MIERRIQPWYLAGVIVDLENEATARPQRTGDYRSVDNTSWLLSRHGKLFLVLSAAALLRLVYFLQYSVLPFLDAPMFDSLAYIRQANAISSGDFGDASLVAFSPLYGYFLATFGDAMIGLQFAMGLLNLWLIFSIVQRTASLQASLVAMGLGLGYGMFMFYESKVLSETLGLTLQLVGYRFFFSANFRAGRWASTLTGGCVMGLAVLARTNLLFSTVFMVGAAFLPWGKSDPVNWRTRTVRTLGFGIGIAAILTLNGIWNQSNMGRFIPLRAMKVSDAQPWDGSIQRFSRDGKSTMVDALDYIRRAEEVLASPPSGFMGMGVSAWKPWDLLRSTPSKLRRVFSDTETTFLYGYYGERSEVPILRWLPVSVGSLLLLALWGMIARIRAEGPWALVPWLPFILGVMASSVMYYPASSYRVPMVPTLVSLSAFGVTEIVRVWRIRVFRPFAYATAAVCLWFAIGTWTYTLNDPAMWHLRVAEGEARRGENAAARERVKRALSIGARSPEVLERIRYVESLMN